jgi:hypothetical protein
MRAGPRRARARPHAGALDRAHEGGQVVEARLRRRVGGGVLAAQHAEQLPHLGHRGASGCRDLAELGRRRVAQPIEAVRRTRRLHVDDRQAVRDDVVQLAGDAVPLLDEHAPLLLGCRVRALAEQLGA